MPAQKCFLYLLSVAKPVLYLFLYQLTNWFLKTRHLRARSCYRVWMCCSLSLVCMIGSFYTSCFFLPMCLANSHISFPEPSCLRSLDLLFTEPCTVSSHSSTVHTCSDWQALPPSWYYFLIWIVPSVWSTHVEPNEADAFSWELMLFDFINIS